MAMETYFDFDAETFQITERKRLSSSSGDVQLTPGLVSPYFKSISSEDTGFETSSDRSSQDSVALLESPQCPNLKTTDGLSCSTCPKASFDSLVSKPVRRYDSKESIKSTSSFWESSFSPETKAVLTKIRDQMRSSLAKVRKLEEEAKQIPLLQVKISILQEEKRQLVSQLDSRNNFKKSRSRSNSISHNRFSSIDELVFGFQDKETRTIGVGEDTIHDILCDKCKEIQSKLLGHSFDLGCNSELPRAVRKLQLRSRICIHTKDDDIKVFQDRCTQTRTPERKTNLEQVIMSTKDCSISTDSDGNSSFDMKNADIRTEESCDPILVETRSVGVGQIKSFLRDTCVGENKKIPTCTERSVQNVVSTSDKSCGVQNTTETIGVNVCPTVVSVGTGCTSFDNTFDRQECRRSTGSQTVKEEVILASLGVGMFSEFTEEILKFNKTICSCSDDKTTSVAVGTLPWMDIEKQILLDYHVSRSTATVAVETRIDNCAVGCGDKSVTDISCQNCVLKSSRSLGVNCSPTTCEKAVGDLVVAPKTCSVGVGECCLTDNYCERCFCLNTRTIGVGSGSVLDTVETELRTEPTLIDLSLDCLAPPQTPMNEEDCNTSGNQSLETSFSPPIRMFIDEYERVTNDLVTESTDGKLCKDLNNAREGILLTCKLLQRYFLNNDKNLNEDKLLLCMKNIEDYWFTCVTDERHDKESLADLIHVLEQHLPYLLDGIINSQDEHGNTALHYLVTYGKFDCVQELLKTTNCNLIITNKAGYSAVMLGSLKEAINSKDKGILKSLFEKGNLNCIAPSTYHLPLKTG